MLQTRVYLQGPTKTLS